MMPPAFRAALRHLTVLPVPYHPREAELAASRLLPWFPVVGLLVGGTVAAVLALPILSLPRAALALAVWIALTGSLHEDGLIDCADAAFAPVDRDRRLEILKDPRAGAHGVITACLAIVLRFAALVHVPAIAPVIAAVTGRWIMTLALAAWPAARPDGLGARFSDGARSLAPTVVAIGTLAILASTTGVLRTGTAATAALCVGMTVAAWLSRRFGGLTGDAYGAVGIVAEIAVLYAFLPLGSGAA